MKSSLLQSCLSATWPKAILFAVLLQTACPRSGNPTAINGGISISGGAANNYGGTINYIYNISHQLTKDSDIELEILIRLRIQPYHLMSDKIGQPAIFEKKVAVRNSQPISYVQALDYFAEQIKSSTELPEELRDYQETVILSLDNSSRSLISNIPIKTIYVPDWYATHQQQGPWISENLGQSIELTRLLTDFAFFSTEKKCLNIAIEGFLPEKFRKKYPQKTHLSIESIIFQVYNFGNQIDPFARFPTPVELSFDSKGLIKQTKIILKPKKPKIEIEPIAVSILDTETNHQIGAFFLAELSRRLEKFSSNIVISSMTLSELIQQREIIKKMIPGQGKGKAIEQYNADFTISGEIVLSPKS